jgi:AraC-like DNA-binding protein
MLHVAIPFTNEVVFSPANRVDNQVNEVIANRYDEVRGALHISVKSFDVEEIAVYMINLKCQESVLIAARLDQAAWLMAFVLKGHLNVSGAGNVINLNLKSGLHHSLVAAAENGLEMVITGDVNLFAVCLGKDVVKKLLTEDEDIALKQIDLLPGRIITPAMHGILNAVMHCAENNCLHRIFLAAKMLELFFLDIDQLKKGDELVQTTVSTGDLEKLKRAKELIAKDIQSPCSLIELAHKVGLNDFKLKRGFKEVFGTTVFGHLADLRMERAREMLSAEYTISEVAHEIGYKNAHHFTAAFKKKFGYLPSDIKKYDKIS